MPAVEYAAIILRCTARNQILVVTYSSGTSKPRTVFPGEPVKDGEQSRNAALRGISDKLPNGICLSDITFDWDRPIVINKGRYYVCTLKPGNWDMDERRSRKDASTVRTVSWCSANDAISRFQKRSGHRRALDLLSQRT